ncbi:Elongation factor G [Symbiodinium microadriaticum]|uniref:Elongation factor G n=2 Tax=Symbiodinium TaxID=2949 RepID=A0A1Q9EA65_SYMMI|nr:Elongation factor G [Symbiodinium microadriaticum]
MGFPVVDVKAKLKDGGFHPVDSSAIAFEIAARAIFKEGASQAKPIVMEPIMKVEVITPEEYMGGIIGDLNSRRGIIQNLATRGNLHVVNASVPLAEMFSYIAELRNLSKGRANYAMEFEKYEAVPENVAESIASKYYGRIKGVPEKELKDTVHRLLQRLGLSPEDAKKATSRYSGGMKRKLSVAIALIGHSQMLFMDEPTAAVDAGAKRHLWKVINKRASDQTVVLTTHSMEEAEALSSRMAIQVKGSLRCLGTTMHIKQKYGTGYQLELFLAQGFSVGEGFATKQEELEAFVQQKISAKSFLLEGHAERFLYQLPPRGESLQLGRVFQAMEAEKNRLGITDYSLSQPSLEQVFLRFAKEQFDAQKAEGNFGMCAGDAALLDALKAVNQAVSMNHMPSPMMPTVPQANSPPKPQLRFCPNCGAKVISQAHRFCAYCCFPFSHLQDETVPAKAPETASPMPLVTTPMQMMQGGGGGLDPMQQSLLMNMQQAAQAGMPQAAMGNFRAGTRMPPSKDDSLLGSLRYFRYVEADQIDVELAKVWRRPLANDPQLLANVLYVGPLPDSHPGFGSSCGLRGEPLRRSRRDHLTLASHQAGICSDCAGGMLSQLSVEWPEGRVEGLALLLTHSHMVRVLHSEFQASALDFTFVAQEGERIRKRPVEAVMRSVAEEASGEDWAVPVRFPQQEPGVYSRLATEAGMDKPKELEARDDAQPPMQAAPRRGILGSWLAPWTSMFQQDDEEDAACEVCSEAEDHRPCSEQLCLEQTPDCAAVQLELAT